MQSLIPDYYKELGEAARSGCRKVAWCSSVGPVELLRSLGFAVYFPENHGAMLGASRRAADFISAASALGLSPDICSYMTSDIGAFVQGKTALTSAYGLASVPRPDVLVYNTNQCRDVQDWFSFYSRHFEAPLLGIESPRGMVDVTSAHLRALGQQYQNLASQLEPIAGQSLDIDRLREVVASSLRCTTLWQEALRRGALRPSPLSFLDATVHMGPAVMLRGDPRAERYYEQLLQELDRRAQGGKGAIADERIRLYWEGMPVWGKQAELTEVLAAQGACVVASTYCHSFVFEGLSHPDPFEGMALAYSELFIARAEAYKERYLRTMAQEYGVDAIVFHDARTCPNNSNNRYGLPQRLRAQLGLPFVVIQGDLNDLRLFSEEQARTQLEALLEQVEAGRP
ncbi:MAG: 2-hydroxyacyl-CoA dehydratase family protein [Myxococcota bacterium]|jgi:benzoyl-CoA reductase/2-hydroxyglutaryl-CoA dehydratase subunit BcrC/BadD/HgdB|nr:2-hydroxyacyl-CoA dehydratase family protein [Myxococcota bacterium]